MKEFRTRLRLKHLNALRRYMRANGLSQRAFARLIGVRSSAVCRWIAGERVPRPTQMAKIFKETGGAVTANDFMRSTDIAD